MRPLVLALIVVSLAGAGCGDNNDTGGTPTGPTQGFAAFTETFAGSIKTGGTAFYSFTMGGTNLGQPANVFFTLASLTNKATGAVVTGASPRIGLGIPAGTGCALVQSVLAAPSLARQMTAFLAPGTYCISITDTGGIAAETDFAIRITQGSLGIKSTTSPETFATNLAVKGTSVRTFTVAGGAGSGFSTITLNSTSPSKVIGFGVGLWRFDNNSCAITATVTSAGGASITLPVDQGTYCVRVFDTGTLTDFVAFSIAMVHP